MKRQMLNFEFTYRTSFNIYMYQRNIPDEGQVFNLKFRHYVAAATYMMLIFMHLKISLYFVIHSAEHIFSNFRKLSAGWTELRRLSTENAALHRSISVNTKGTIRYTRSLCFRLWLNDENLNKHLLVCGACTVQCFFAKNFGRLSGIYLYKYKSQK